MRSQLPSRVLIIAALLLAVFSGYAEQIILGSPNRSFYEPPAFLQKIDQEGYLLVRAGFASDFADKFFPVLTLLGSTPLWFGTCAALWFARKRKIAVLLVISLIAGSLLTLLIKTTLPRQRPLILFGLANSYESDSSSSFPSGHAKNVFTAAALTGRRNIPVKAVMYVLAIAVGLSRIYLGFHWPSDVLAGAFIGWGVARLVNRWRNPIISKILGPQASR